MINRQLLLTYLYLLIYICLSSGVILYNKVKMQFIDFFFVIAWLVTGSIFRFWKELALVLIFDNPVN